MKITNNKLNFMTSPLLRAQKTEKLKNLNRIRANYITGSYIQRGIKRIDIHTSKKIFSLFILHFFFSSQRDQNNLPFLSLRFNICCCGLSVCYGRYKKLPFFYKCTHMCIFFFYYSKKKNHICTHTNKMLYFGDAVI